MTFGNLQPWSAHFFVRHGISLHAAMKEIKTFSDNYFRSYTLIVVVFKKYFIFDKLLRKDVSNLCS